LDTSNIVFTSIYSLENRFFQEHSFYNYLVSNTDSLVDKQLYRIYIFSLSFRSFSFLRLALQKATLQYRFWTTLVEGFYFFLLDIVRLQGGLRTMRYFFLFYFLFFFVFFSNFIGLLPYGFAITSHIIHNFFISITCFLTIIVLAFKNKGFDFIKGFVPLGFLLG
jgi:F0F1-type ATP synthase membrane subunit a